MIESIEQTKPRMT